jgi:hypothetical protein
MKITALDAKISVRTDRLYEYLYLRLFSFLIFMKYYFFNAQYYKTTFSILYKYIQN